MKTLISIVGTTGIGKTKLAIDLAIYYATEIISCDSRQFFNGMKIGTAAPSNEELSKVKHHFIGHLEVTDYYSIGQYEVEALELIQQLFEKHDIVILVGGSMMYEKALIEGLNDLPEANEKNQQILKEIWENQGLEALQNLLKELDPDYYAKVDLENPRRLLRAIDIMWQTGETYSTLISNPTHQRDFKTIRIGIEAPREIIYERINKRVELMVENGLLDEVIKLENHQNLVALKTVGYTELFKYLNDEWKFDFAISEIQKNSRRFAKRQLTWYRKEENIHWVNYENAMPESVSLLKEIL